jgi:hypothetical protein
MAIATTATTMTVRWMAGSRAACTGATPSGTASEVGERALRLCGAQWIAIGTSDADA